MKAKKRVRDETVRIPLCVVNGGTICEEMIPGEHCIYSEFCPIAENNATSRLIGKITKEN